MAKPNFNYAWQDLAFCAALVERMYPNFKIFCDAFNYPKEADSFRNILDLCWQHIAADTIKIDFEKQQHKLEAITPNAGNDEGIGLSLAQDACVGLMSLLEMCEGQENISKGEVLRLYISGIYRYIEFIGKTSDQEVEQELIHDSKAYTAMLDEQLTRLSQKNISHFANELKAIGVSNIGISLEN